MLNIITIMFCRVRFVEQPNSTYDEQANEESTGLFCAGLAKLDRCIHNMGTVQPDHRLAGAKAL